MIFSSYCEDQTPGAITQSLHKLQITLDHQQAMGLYLFTQYDGQFSHCSILY